MSNITKQLFETFKKYSRLYKKKPTNKNKDYKDIARDLVLASLKKDKNE